MVIHGYRGLDSYTGYGWLYMVIDGYIDGYTWLSTGIHGYGWLYKVMDGVHGYGWLYMVIDGYICL